MKLVIIWYVALPTFRRSYGTFGRNELDDRFSLGCMCVFVFVLINRDATMTVDQTVRAARVVPTMVSTVQ
jgi:hypothetical protein